MTSPSSLRVSKIALSLVSCALMAGCQQTLQTPVGVPTPPSTTTSTAPAPTTVAPAVAYDATSNVYYVANGFAGTVTVVDGSSNAVTATIPVAAAGTDLYSIAVDPATDLVYVVSNQTGTMTVINGATNQIVTPVATGLTQPVAVAVDPTSDMVYVLGQGTQNLKVYNGATNALVAGLEVAGTTYGLAVNSATNTIFVSSVGLGSVTVGTESEPQSGPWLTVINGATNAVTSTVLLQNTLTALAVNQTTNMVYGSNSAENQLTVIGQGTSGQWATATTYAVGGSPGPLAVNPVTNTVYVGNMATDSISAVDFAVNPVTVATIPLTGSPTGLATNYSTATSSTPENLLYVADAANVTVINGATNTITTTAAPQTTSAAAQ